MIILAIESATIEVGAALHDESGLLAALVARPGRRHVETLHPAIEAVCSAANVTMLEIDAVAVDIGPGRYTGIRVAIAAAKGFCLALGIPAIACRSTDILRHVSRLSHREVVPVIDMRRGEVAWPTRRNLENGSSDGNVEAAAIGLRLGTVEELIAELVEIPRPCLLVGDGAERYGAAITQAVVRLGGVEPGLAGASLAAPPVSALAALGLERLLAGDVTTGEDLMPLYLRTPDVRINWTERPPVAASASEAISS